jgi:uncharacterized membrane protein YeaQ/YmgE (transglycosylase-associated protein family)
MIFVIFLVLLALFVLLPLIGWAVWFFISAAVSGLVLGALARLIVPGRHPIGLLATIVSGWIGSLVGGAIGVAAFGRHHHHFGTILIEIGVAALTVLTLSAGARLANSHGDHNTTGKGHRVIDV